MRKPCSPVTDSLRAIVLGYILFFIAGYESTTEFARWCDRWWRSRHPFTPEQSKPNSKWFDLLRGAWPRKPCSRELLDDFPTLARAYENPLWTVLSWPSRSVDLAELFVRRVRVNGECLLPFTCKGMESLCGYPDWTRLAYLVALLRTRAPEYALHRLWLSKHFSSYVLLVCLVKPCCACSSHLYRHLHTLYLLGALGAVDYWPGHLQSFHEALEERELLWEALAENNWFSTWDVQSVTMLWRLQLEPQLRALLKARFAKGQSDCPRGLQRRVQTIINQHQKAVIELVT